MDSAFSMLRSALQNAFNSGSGSLARFSPMTAYRFTESRIDMPKQEKLYLYLVVDGIPRLYTPSGIMDYQPGQYSIPRIDMPLHGTILSFSENNDFLAVSLDLTVNEVIAAVLDLDNVLVEKVVKAEIPEQ